MPIEIREVAGRRDLKTFVELPYRLYRNEPLWVPPLRFERMRFLDRAKNPFFQHADVALFLAERDGEVVGRVSAHIDHNLNRFQENRWGQFGFFDAIDDQEVATALIDRAAEWARERGRDRIVGPMDFTTNDEIGVLVEGFERAPIILTPWTHRYYPALLEGANLGKAMDVLMWELHIEGRDKVHPAIWEMAAKVKTDHGITCRPFSKKDLKAEVERFLEVYNAAWERNWGFVPLEPDEVREYAKTLKPVLDEHWAMVAEKEDGEVVGAALSLPDYNQVLKQLGGRIGPLRAIRALRARKRIDRVRVFALGVKPEYQHTGVAARFYEMHFDSAEVTPQTWGEMGWILETNKPMNRAMEGMGGKIVSRYRVYERLLEDDAVPSPGARLAAAAPSA